MSDLPQPAKSASAFRTIGEVAGELGVAQHVLRFWETRFPQVQPLKRGGNRRYYRPADVDLLRDIHRMLHAEGYTIKGVQRRLEEAPSRHPRVVAEAFSPAAATFAPNLLGDQGDTGTGAATFDSAAFRAVRDRLAGALAAARA